MRVHTRNLVAALCVGITFLAGYFWVTADRETLQPACCPETAGDQPAGAPLEAGRSGFGAKGDGLLTRKFEGASPVGTGQASLAGAGNALAPLPRKGRVVRLEPRLYAGWRDLRSGDRTALPDVEERGLEGRVHLRREEGEWIRLGGALVGEAGGAFSLNVRASPPDVAGSVLLPGRGVGFQVLTQPSGDVLLIERPLRELMCWPGLAAAAAQEAGAESVAGKTAAASSSVPRLNTRPGARGLIYINFEGEQTTEPRWNFGNTISAAPSTLNSNEIEEVVARVAEDYAPFDIAVSTIRADYDAAQPGTRMRVIVTPTSTALPGSGGVAMTDSWRNSGKTESETIPAWVFVNSAKSIAEGVSHEVGHTLGLNHDGTYLREYYTGHDGDLNSPISWAPIMGQSYYRSLTQWSKGEYSGANNFQDDLELISRKENKFGYRLDQTLGRRSLTLNSGRFEAKGVLVKSTLPDRYMFGTAGGRFEAYAKPAVPRYANVDLRLELSSASGALLAVGESPETLEASLVKNLSEGFYELRVSAAGTGSRPASGYASGYSEYGSLGSYVLSGLVETPALPLEVLSPLEVSGVLGKTFSYVFRFGEGVALSDFNGARPQGLVWNAGARALSGTPLESGTFEFRFTLTGEGRRAERVLRLVVHSSDIPAVAGAYGRPATSPLAPWTPQIQQLPDGSQGVVSASGVVGDGGETWLRYTVPGGSVASFWWKVSSEAEADQIFCKVDGQTARDALKGYPLVYSGESGWVQQRVRLEGKSALVEFVYRKDFSLSEGQDRAWVYGFQVGRLPVFSKMPQPLRLNPGQTSFALEGAAEHATSYQWKRNGVPLSDGPRVGGSVCEGTRTAHLSVRGVSVADSGLYVLEAGSDLGSVESSGAQVSIPGLPVVEQPLLSSLSVRTGDALSLSFQVAGERPFFVLWKRNGQPVRWTQEPQLVLPEAGTGASGLYQATVINAYGSVSTNSTSVVVTP